MPCDWLTVLILVWWWRRRWCECVAVNSVRLWVVWHDENTILCICSNYIFFLLFYLFLTVRSSATINDNKTVNKKHIKHYTDGFDEFLVHIYQKYIYSWIFIQRQSDSIVQPDVLSFPMSISPSNVMWPNAPSFANNFLSHPNNNNNSASQFFFIFLALDLSFGEPIPPETRMTVDFVVCLCMRAHTILLSYYLFFFRFIFFR